jgi:hypothetical protein
MVKETQYNEGWCVVAFLIDHEVGRDYFVKLVEAFRNRDHLSQIQARLFTEEFLTGFERAWHRFIEKKVLKKLEMETVGGKKLRPGDTSPPPRGTEGWPLTGDSRGDLFLVAAEAGVAPKAFAGEKWWMLKAWGMPARFYAEAWRRAPHVAAGKRVRLVGGLYRLQAIEGLGGPGSRAFVLFPAWLPSTASDEIAARLPGAAAKLIETAKGKAGEGKKPPAPPAGERGAAATD